MDYRRHMYILHKEVMDTYVYTIQGSYGHYSSTNRLMSSDLVLDVNPRVSYPMVSDIGQVACMNAKSHKNNYLTNLVALFRLGNLL